MTVTERFTVKIDKLSGAPCWLWIGSRVGRPASRYGKFYPTRTKFVKAHRFAWELFNGRPIPEGLVICHSCDNKLCVNPDHLRAETQAFNIREAIERGRWKPNIGTANGRALLTPSQVEQMRISDGTQEMLAASFGISQSQVSRIIRGESWKKSAA